MEDKSVKSESDLLQELIIKSEDEFEKKISYIGAGALLLSLTLLEKIIKLENSYFIGFLVSSWIFFILSLIINLLSHLISKIFFRNIQEEIENKISHEERIKNHKKRVNKIETLNWASAISLILGIIFLIVFASSNAIHYKKFLDFKNFGLDKSKVEISDNQ